MRYRHAVLQCDQATSGLGSYNPRSLDVEGSVWVGGWVLLRDAAV